MSLSLWYAGTQQEKKGAMKMRASGYQQLQWAGMSRRKKMWEWWWWIGRAGVVLTAIQSNSWVDFLGRLDAARSSNNFCLAQGRIDKQEVQPEKRELWAMC